MPPRSVEVVAPSRLHFGLLSLGSGGHRQFGGAGVMVQQPGLRLRIAPAEQFATVGPLGPRVRRTVARFARSRPLSELPACRIEVRQSPPQHAGPGTGTQLALSVVAGLCRFCGDGPLEPHALAEIAGRAARSAVGTHGFARGGMILESGKRQGQSLAPLEGRLELPDSWRFVLIVPGSEQGLSGDEERRAFDSLPPVPASTTAALREELTERLFPAAARGDFAGFSESLYRYGYTAGMCFAARQEGPFASACVSRLVECIRTLGVRGVGQSSWGPTVFAAVESGDAAEVLCNRLRGHVAADDVLIVAAPNNTGARITVHDG